MKVKFKDLTIEQINNICLKQVKSQCDDCPIARQCDENFAHSPIYFGAFEEEIDLPDDEEQRNEEVISILNGEDKEGGQSK